MAYLMKTVILLFCIFALSVVSAAELVFDRNEVQDIVLSKDKKTLWIATQGGLEWYCRNISRYKKYLDF